MTNSDSTPNFEKLLARIVACLDEEVIRRRIDEPLEQAASSFTVDPALPRTHRNFHRVIQAFTHHLYLHGMPIAQKLSPAQALDEAIAILEQTYRNQDSTGYDAAYLDAMNSSHNGYEMVILTIAETLRQRARQNYRNWVFTTHLKTLAWENQRELAHWIFTHHRSDLSPMLAQALPASMINDLPLLIKELVKANQEIMSRVSR